MSSPNTRKFTLYIYRLSEVTVKRGVRAEAGNDYAETMREIKKLKRLDS